MSYTVSVTSQGQISLPAKIRKQLGISRSGKAIVSVQDGKVIVEPVKDFLEMAGSLKTMKKPLSSQEIHDFTAQSVVDELAKKIK
jgi:AbrB family looped-hinge helix DNA binding protein